MVRPVPSRIALASGCKTDGGGEAQGFQKRPDVRGAAHRAAAVVMERRRPGSLWRLERMWRPV